jgi:PAS domain S-box-containing protein
MADQQEDARGRGDELRAPPTEGARRDGTEQGVPLPTVQPVRDRFSLELCGDGLGMCDASGRIVFVNERLCEMLGYRAEELVGEPADALLGRGVECAHPPDKTLEDKPGPTREELMVRCKDGTLLPVVIERQQIFDVEGQLLVTLGVVIDVTRRTLWEQTLRENAEWHRLIVDNLNDVFWVAQIDLVRRPTGTSLADWIGSFDVDDMMSRWRFIYVSPSFEPFVGRPLADAYQMNLRDIVAETHYDAARRELAWYVREAVTHPDGASTPNVITLPVATATGGPRWVEMSARVLYDEGRQLLRFVGVTRDITRRYEAEEALRANEEKLRAISDAAQDAVMIVDAEGKTAHWNPAAERMFGYRAEEILGRDAHAILAPRRLDKEIRRGIRAFQQTGQGAVVGRVIQSAAVRKDGSEFPVEVAVSPITIDGRRAAVGIVRDVTERVRAEEEIRKEQRRLMRLLDVYESHRKMATYEIHDGVTQPLVSAIMRLEAFSPRTRECCPEAPWSDFDAAIAVLREALSETRRFMSGMRPPVLDELGVVSALDHLIREHRVSSTAVIEYHRSVGFERLSPPLETTIFRIVQEALHNARQHSQAKNIRVEFVEEGDRVRILVQDWGVGFHPADVPADHFGLEGIRHRAAAVGGCAEIDSAPGAGTRIRVDLPLLREQDAKEKPGK